MESGKNHWTNPSLDRIHITSAHLYLRFLSCVCMYVLTPFTSAESHPPHFLKSYVFKLRMLFKLSSAGSNCTSMPCFPAPTTRWSVCLNCTSHCLLIFAHNLGKLLYQLFYQPQIYPLMYYIHKQFLLFLFRYGLKHAALASLELHGPG